MCVCQILLLALVVALAFALFGAYRVIRETLITRRLCAKLREINQQLDNEPRSPITDVVNVAAS